MDYRRLVYDDDGKLVKLVRNSFHVAFQERR